MGYALRLWFRNVTMRTAVTGFLMLSLAVSLAGGVFARSASFCKVKCSGKNVNTTPCRE